ncbi:MAG: hypothetical protein J6Q22_09420 [Prevotella sp.]|nr:hypothetical protein [Prevotella sp.]
MIIDMILDRMDDEKEGVLSSYDYDPEEAKSDFLDYADVFGFGYIKEAVESGDEEKTKTALVRYVAEEYGGDAGIKEYVRSVDWLPKK